MTAQTKCEKCGAWVEAFSVARHICRSDDDLLYRLEKRAEIRRQIPGRKSVENGEPDRIADLLEEAATEIERLQSHMAVEARIRLELVRTNNLLRAENDRLYRVIELNGALK